MPRNGSGTYSVPTSFSSGTTISSSAVNGNFSDIGTEITGSLPRDGQAAMTGQLKAASGTVSEPGIAFSADLDTGVRRSAANTMMAVAGGSDIAAISDTGITMQSGKLLTDGNGAVVVGIPTGVMWPYLGTAAPTGWVLASGKTIGDASSSATGRANADTEDLFDFLWTNFADAECAVSGGRGASAAADFAAHKAITLPDMRGRGFFGLDNIGGSAASRLGSAITSATTNGATGGSETVTLTTTHLPASGLTVTATADSNGAHTHTFAGTSTSRYAGSTGGTFAYSADFGGTTTTSSSGAHTHTVTGTTSNLGSGGAHSNMPPALLGTWIIKL